MGRQAGSVTPYFVDLNRNYGYMWGLPGSSGNPTSSTYRGPFAFSEPETQALRDLCLAHNFRSMITYHNYGGEVACTWGYTYDPTPDFCRDRHIADVMETLMNEVHGAGYTSPELYPYLTENEVPICKGNGEYTILPEGKITCTLPDHQR